MGREKPRLTYSQRAFEGPSRPPCVVLPNPVSLARGEGFSSMYIAGGVPRSKPRQETPQHESHLLPQPKRYH